MCSRDCQPASFPLSKIFATDAREDCADPSYAVSAPAALARISSADSLQSVSTRDGDLTDSADSQYPSDDEGATTKMASRNETRGAPEFFMVLLYILYSSLDILWYNLLGTS